MTVGSLFAGIGGFDLAAERVGWQVKWQVEIDPFCRQVLAKHWPNVRRYEDVRTVGAELERVDVICGGFPCQDISYAGPGDGLDGERSGLWHQMHRLVNELRPRYLVVENVAALLDRGMGTILGNLAASGYDAEWDCLPAGVFGAEHFRDRVVLVAYPMRAGLPLRTDAGADAPHARVFGKGLGFTCGVETAGLERRGESRWRGDIHGIPNRVDRVKALGNSIVPQVAEWIFRQIQAAEESAVTP